MQDPFFLFLDFDYRMHRCLLFLSLFACWVEAENGFGRKGDITGLKVSSNGKCPTLIHTFLKSV